MKLEELLFLHTAPLHKKRIKVGKKFSYTFRTICLKYCKIFCNR